MDPIEPRDPESGDLVKICRALNRTAENISRLKQSLSILPDNAVAEMQDTDLETYGTVRIADEVVVNLMSSACGIDFEEASSMVEASTIAGVDIPFANPELLLKTKQTVREKDEIDRLFLKRLIAERHNS